MDGLLTGLPLSTWAPGGLLFGLLMLAIRVMYAERRDARGQLKDELARKNAELDRAYARIQQLEDKLYAATDRRWEVDS